MLDAVRFSDVLFGFGGTRPVKNCFPNSLARAPDIRIRSNINIQQNFHRNLISSRGVRRNM